MRTADIKHRASLIARLEYDRMTLADVELFIKELTNVLVELVSE